MPDRFDLTPVDHDPFEAMGAIPGLMPKPNALQTAPTSLQGNPAGLGLPAGVLAKYAGEQVEGLHSMATLPGDVALGRVNPNSEEGFGRTMGLALGLAGGPLASPKGGGVRTGWTGRAVSDLSHDEFAAKLDYLLRAPPDKPSHALTPVEHNPFVETAPNLRNLYEAFENPPEPTPGRGAGVSLGSMRPVLREGSPEMTQAASDYLGRSPNAGHFGAFFDDIGMAPKEFFSSMHGDNISQAAMNPMGKGVQTRAILHGQDGQEIGLIERSFPGNGTVDHSYFQLNLSAQGQNVAKEQLARQIPLYQKMGLDAVTLHANIDVGGYAWAKYGFTPATTEWKSLVPEIGERLFEAQPHLHPDTYKAANQLLASENPKTLWDIADLTEKVDGQPLGKYLLKGTDWHGKLDLRDPTSMERFNSYVSRAVPSR